MNHAEVIQTLAARVADIVETDDGAVLGVQMLEAADGSGRWLALVQTDTAGLDQEYRVTLPAPASAPSWARRFTDEIVEVRVGDQWLRLKETTQEVQR